MESLLRNGQTHMTVAGVQYKDVSVVIELETDPVLRGKAEVSAPVGGAANEEEEDEEQEGSGNPLKKPRVEKNALGGASAPVERALAGTVGEQDGSVDADCRFLTLYQIRVLIDCIATIFEASLPFKTFATLDKSYLMVSRLLCPEFKGSLTQEQFAELHEALRLGEARFRLTQRVGQFFINTSRTVR